jgi:hypothetical protein
MNSHRYSMVGIWRFRPARQKLADFAVRVNREETDGPAGPGHGSGYQPCSPTRSTKATGHTSLHRGPSGCRLQGSTAGSAGWSDRDDETPSLCQLLHKRDGTSGPPCGDDDAVKGRSAGPTQGAIILLTWILNSQATKAVHALARKALECAPLCTRPHPTLANTADWYPDPVPISNTSCQAPPSAARS